MSKEKRRAEIMVFLKEAKTPLTGSELSESLGVTRQVIVGDVAVLRARGEQIIATPRGYLLHGRKGTAVHRRTVAVRHGGDNDALAAELNLIVDLGGTIVDVIVEHPLYGELTANLQLSSRYEVAQFITKMEELQAEPLLVLTDGYHLHTIEAPNSEVMGAIEDELRAKGLLAE